jgi:xanthine dehydrogenase iron-sulfur cluster and FAD-binding subunit A
LNEQTLREVASELALLGTPLSDQRASAAYRAAMRDRLLEKFWLASRSELSP